MQSHSGMPCETSGARSCLSHLSRRVRRTLPFAVLSFSLFGPPAHGAALGSQVVVSGGAIQTTSPRDSNGVLAFKGIPFSAPPVGKLRWRPPQPVQPWQGTRDATDFGPRCEGAPLQGVAPAGSTQSEDCLTLNVWSAAQSVGERRPVLVWIHGGGFQTGVPTPADPRTSGAALASRGVVVVSLNYRLGVFGFLAHPALDAEGSPSGNFGLQDQMGALRWVRANIARFGGDSSNVTVFGQSAGAASIGVLMSSPLARGLFDKAIGESGAFVDGPHGSIATKQEAQARGQALVSQLAGGSIATMRAISADDLIAATPWSGADPVVDAFSPNIDGYVVTDSPAHVFALGRQIDVPLLAGRNGDEGAIFVGDALPHGTAAAFQQAAAAQFGVDRLADFLTQYPASTDAQAASSAQTLIGDLTVNEQSWEWLQLERSTGRSPTWGYQFNYHSGYSPLPVHGSEIGFVFGNLLPTRLAPTTPPNARDVEVSNQLMSYWVNFARTGNPNGGSLPTWPAYTDAGSQVLIFNDGLTGPSPEQDTARLNFLRSFRSAGRFPASWRQTGG